MLLKSKLFWKAAFRHKSILSRWNTKRVEFLFGYMSSGNDKNNIHKRDDGGLQSVKKWIKPEGFDTGIKVSNHYACFGSRKRRQLVPLIVKDPNEITWYACGPTVYDDAHLGHASSYVRFDAIRRILTDFFGFHVKMVMGMTNIDDKIIARAQLLDREFLSLAELFETRFQKDMCSLNVGPPFRYMRVSDHIHEMIKFVEVLLKSNHAYTNERGDVWFDTDHFTNVGRLLPFIEEYDSGRSMPELKQEIKSRRDFALWKAVKPGEPYWDTPWGKGRPGWHLECSTMGSLAFGSEIDIHSGGKDLCFPHHECELLQSEAFHGCSQWVNYFFHSGELKHDQLSSKMSKSLGNVISVTQFLQDWSPDIFRYAVLSLPWHADMIYNPKDFRRISDKLIKIDNFFVICQSYLSGELNVKINSAMVFNLLEMCRAEVFQHLRNDFDTPSVLKALMKLMEEISQMLNAEEVPNADCEMMCIKHAVRFISDCYEKLGFLQLSSYKLIKKTESNMNEVLQIWVNYRSELRKTALDNIKSSDQTAVNMAKEVLNCCDDVRKQLSEHKIDIADTKTHSTIFQR